MHKNWAEKVYFFNAIRRVGSVFTITSVTHYQCVLTLEWENHVIENRLQHCYLAVRRLKRTHINYSLTLILQNNVSQNIKLQYSNVSIFSYTSILLWPCLLPSRKCLLLGNRLCSPCVHETFYLRISYLMKVYKLYDSSAILRLVEKMLSDVAWLTNNVWDHSIFWTTGPQAKIGPQSKLWTCQL